MQIKSLFVIAAVAAQTMLGEACVFRPPGNKNENTVTAQFYTGSEAVVQNITMGVLNTCHLLKGPAHSFNMAVGQNLFGRNIRLNTFSNYDCSGGRQAWRLTNSGACFVSGGSDWHSVQIAQV